MWLALDARPRERRLDEGVEATLEGFVRDFAGAGSFTLNGVAVGTAAVDEASALTEVNA